MKTLYLDCSMGAAGDMLTAALLELLPDPDSFVETLNHLGIPHVQFVREQSSKCGILGTHMSVLVDGQEEDEPHDHHHHAHHGLPEIEALVADLSLPETVKRDVLAVYTLIAEAESQAHGLPIREIHFHEVGTLDAVADVSAVCLLLHTLQPDRIVASPVHVGSGTVQCAHGILPVPAPATAHILRGVPIYGGAIRGELCTPTGAALLKHFVTEFGAMPMMTVSRVGYGMGKKDFPQANCVRAMVGDSDLPAERVLELHCNVDDMTGEDLGYAMDRLLADGALDVFTEAIGMKKSRPGIKLCVLCREKDREAMVTTLLRHTTTLGVREQACRRYTLERELRTVETPFGPIREKISRGPGICRQKYEYEDLARIARERGLSLEEIRRQLDQKPQN